MLESLFNKVAGLKVCNFIKRKLQQISFSVNMYYEMINTFFYRTPPVTAAVLQGPLLHLLLKINTNVLHTLYPVPSQHLLVQSQRLKRPNNIWNLLKINNKDIRTSSLMSLAWFWCSLLLTLNRFHALFECFHC